MNYQLVREYHERLIKEFGGTKKLPTTFKSWTKGAVTRKIENVFKDFLMDRLNEEDRIDTYLEPVPNTVFERITDDESDPTKVLVDSDGDFDPGVEPTDSDATPPWEEEYTGVSEP